MFVTVQLEAVEAADDFKDFKSEVGEFWDSVRNHLKLTVRRWSDKTKEDQSLFLSAYSLKDRDQQEVLARAINKLLGITREWRV